MFDQYIERVLAPLYRINQCCGDGKPQHSRELLLKVCATKLHGLLLWLLAINMFALLRNKLLLHLEKS